MPNAEPEIEELLATSGASGRLSRAARIVLWAGIAILVAAGALAYWVFSGAEDKVSYVSEPVTRGNLTVSVTATGAIQPINKVEISSELSGIIKSVEADYNDTVRKGQVLARLDTDKLAAQVEHSRATLIARTAKVTEAKATATEKKQQLDRIEQLAARQVSSQQDLEAARAAYLRAVAAVQSAEADVKVAEADLKLNATTLEKSCICSSIDGVVLSRNVEPGQTVAASLQAPVLFTLAEDLAKMELQVDIDEADIGKVRVGQTARFTVEAYPERVFPATITTVRYASQTVEGVVTYKAILAVDNSELLLRPGMTATAEIVVEQVDDVVLIPNAALRFVPPAEVRETSSRGLLSAILPRPPRQQAVPREPDSASGERSVWLLKDGVPVQVLITIGVSDGSRTHMLKGDLAPGDRLVVDTLS